LICRALDGRLGGRRQLRPTATVFAAEVAVAVPPSSAAEARQAILWL
jgi:hypothetical protein